MHEMAPIFPTILSSVGKRRYFHFKEIIWGPRQRIKITDAFQELFKNYSSPSYVDQDCLKLWNFYEALSERFPFIFLPLQLLLA